MLAPPVPKARINGTVTQGMRSVLAGAPGAAHASRIAAAVVRGLGLSFAEAERIAHRPLPPLPPAAIAAD